MDLRFVSDRDLLARERELENDLAKEEARHEGAAEEIAAFHAPSECLGIVYERANKIEAELEAVWLAVRRRGLKPWPSGW